MTADVVFGVFVFYGLVFGLRRGFYKELLAFAALVVGVAAARTWRDTAGQALHDKTGLQSTLAHVLGGFAVFVVTVFVVNLIGRLVLKKLRDPDAENSVGAAAEKVADAASGDTKAGPVTLLTNPIAKAHKSAVYWSDKLIGGVIGVVKGAAAAYALFAAVYFADTHLANGNWSFTKSIMESQAKAVYSNHLAGILRELPEYRVVENIGRVETLVTETKGDPSVVDRIAQHPAWAGVRATDAFRELSKDPEIAAAWAKVDEKGRRDLPALLASPKVRALLVDPRFRDVFAETNVEAILKTLATNLPPASAPPGPTPPGTDPPQPAPTLPPGAVGPGEPPK